MSDHEVQNASNFLAYSDCRDYSFFFLTHNKTYTSLYFFSSDTLGMIDFRRETRTGALARQFLHRAGLETRQVEEETPPSRYC